MVDILDSIQKTSNQSAVIDIASTDNGSMTSSFEDVSAEVTQRYRDNGNQETDPGLMTGLGGGIGKVVADQVRFH